MSGGWLLRVDTGRLKGWRLGQRVDLVLSDRIKPALRRSSCGASTR